VYLDRQLDEDVLVPKVGLLEAMKRSAMLRQQSNSSALLRGELVLLVSRHELW
jgi:hypothetical protein